MSAGPSAFARFGDFALFLVGALMVAAGVFLVADGAGRVVLYLLGTGLMVMGALLPRLSGTIKISPGSVELTVIQQLEATRREAEQRIPDRVEEAVGLAFRRLVEEGVLAGSPRADASPRAPAAPPPFAPAKSGGLFVLAIAAGVLLLGLVSSVVLWLDFGDGVGTAPPGSPASADSALGLLLLLGAALVALGAGLVVARRKAKAQRAVGAPSSSENAEQFAQRIVAEMRARSD